VELGHEAQALQAAHHVSWTSTDIAAHAASATSEESRPGATPQGKGTPRKQHGSPTRPGRLRSPGSPREALCK
jgi:hypothetical protein